MFFHTELGGPKSSSRGTSSAKGPNSTWSVTINPSRLTQTPYDPSTPTPPPHTHPQTHNTQHSSEYRLDFTTSCQVHPNTAQQATS